MDAEQMHSIDATPTAANATSTPKDPAMTGVRRWLEDAWRHGEIVADDDWVEMIEPARQPDRFDVSRRSVDAASQDIV